MNDDIEKSILGACFLSDGVDAAIAGVRPEDFKLELHRAIFEAIGCILNDGGFPDLSTVGDKLRSQGHKNISGYLAEIVDYVPTASNLGYYIKRLKDQALMRRLTEMSAEILNGEHETGKEALEYVHSIISERDDDSKTDKAAGILKNVLKNMEDRYANKGQLLGVKTGIDKLDTMLSGLCKKDMVVLAARPSIGKTALALNIVEAACIMNGTPTLFLSLEMGKDELIERLLHSMARIDQGIARSGNLQASAFGAITDVAQKIHSAPLWIDQSSGCSMAQLKAKARAAKRRYGVGLVVIDYLGLVWGKGKEYDVITEASKEVKRMAVELDLPVLCLHQLNRNNEGRQDKTPTMSDLRSSGQIEQDADVILFIHREKKEPVEDALIIIEKQRKGPCGKVPVRWHGPHNRFEGEAHWT